MTMEKAAIVCEDYNKMCKLPLRYNYLIEISNNVHRVSSERENLQGSTYINISLLKRVIVCLQRASVVFLYV